MDGENENPNNTNSGAENQEGVGNKEVDYEELIKTDKKLQSFLDSRTTASNKTAVENARKQWELENNEKVTEAEKLAKMNETQKLQYQLQQKDKSIEEIQKKLNARDLKDEAIGIATNPETAFDPEFLNLFKFENMTAEELQKITKSLKTIQDRIVEQTINEWSKEKPPYNPDPSGNKPTANEAVRKAMGLK